MHSVAISCVFVLLIEDTFHILLSFLLNSNFAFDFELTLFLRFFSFHLGDFFFLLITLSPLKL